MEGGIFRGFSIVSKLLSDLDLGATGDVRSDLRGHMRSQRSKMLFFTIFEIQSFWTIFTDIRDPSNRITSNLTSEVI